MKTIKNLLDIKSLEKEEILCIIQKAQIIKKKIQEGNKVFHSLSGKSIATLFYENSTRTRNSFENAAKFLGVNTVSVDVSRSSVQKGESLIDTAITLKKISTDALIIRHSIAGTPLLVAKSISIPVINAGDGMHSHPTQALLDAMTIAEYKDLENVKILIIGDIKHSRVAMSQIALFKKFGAEVGIVGPETLMPLAKETLGVKIYKTLEEGLKNTDVISTLRIQFERQGNLFPSLKEYTSQYQINEKTIKYAKSDAIIIHPGPVNEGIEIAASLVRNNKYSKIDEQVQNGLCIRMAILEMLLGGENDNSKC